MKRSYPYHLLRETEEVRTEDWCACVGVCVDWSVPGNYCQLMSNDLVQLFAF